jgi:hypothetical protein
VAFCSAFSALSSDLPVCPKTPKNAVSSHAECFVIGKRVVVLARCRTLLPT